MSEPLPWTDVRPDEDGRFDELTCRDVEEVHVEMLDNGICWIAIYGAGGHVTLHLQAKKRIQVSVEHHHETGAGRCASG